ncbi:MAG: hypothetical protein AAGB34_10180 [Planctomycetota bacterium]
MDDGSQNPSARTPALWGTRPLFIWHHNETHLKLNTALPKRTVAAGIVKIGTLGLLADGDQGLLLRRTLFFSSDSDKQDA